MIKIVRVTGILGGPVRVGLLCIAVVCLLCSYSPISNLLYYDQHLVVGGQYWRPLTAWLVQLNEKHWLLNMWGLVVLALLLPTRLSRSSLAGFAFVWIVSSLLLAMSDYQSYVGLSGLLYGWLAWGAFLSPNYSKLIKFVFVIAVSTKVVAENLPSSWLRDGIFANELSYLSSDWVAKFLDADVAHLSHAWGLFAGLLYIMISWTVQRLK